MFSACVFGGTPFEEVHFFHFLCAGFGPAQTPSPSESYRESEKGYLGQSYWRRKDRMVRLVPTIAAFAAFTSFVRPTASGPPRWEKWNLRATPPPPSSRVVPALRRASDPVVGIWGDPSG